MFLYNGRNDLAEIAVHTLLREIGKGNEIRFDLSFPLGLARFADLVTRFGAEMAPEVGPPFYTR
jgi:hypothetical protein